MTITLRQTTQAGATNKGSSLTFQEMDDTVIDLLTNKIQAIQVDADSTNASVGLAQGTGVLEIKGGTNITTAITADSAGTATLTITGTTFLANLTDDSSPQLSANLDMNGQKIVTTSNANLVLAPSGSGVVEIQGDGASADGTIQLNCSQNSHGIKLASPPHSAGQSYTLTFPSTAPASGKILETDGSGNLSFVDMPSGGDSVQEGDNISITSPDSAGGKTIAFRNPLNQPVVGGDQTFSQINLKDYSETVYTSGTTTGTITPDVANGNVQSITLSGSITFSAFANAAAGQSMTMIIRQPSSGGPYTLTSTMKFAGGTKTLSTTADAYDIMTVFYDGTNYFASLSTNFS
tara:strand:- start:175 stop:1221 length:1047 start_codon:yes stop_codon:yes gene_type:complete